MAAKKILMITGDFTEDYETMVPFQALLMVGHTVTVCPARRPASRSRPPCTTSRATRPTAKSRATTSPSTPPFADIKAADYDALVIPGGRARNTCA